MDTFRLAFKGIALNDLEDRLSEWNIVDGSIMHMFNRRVTSPGVPK